MALREQKYAWSGHRKLSLLCLLLLLCIEGSHSIKWITMRFHRRYVWVPQDCVSKNFNQKITRFCYKHLNLMKYIMDSGEVTIRECKENFKYRRWDCTSIDKAPDFETDLKEDTKESAMVHALYSSALVMTISRGCMTGAIKDCQCSKKFAYLPRGRQVREVRFSQCSDFVLKGMTFAKKFTDAAWKRKRKFRLSNEIKLHNSKTGRQVVRNLQTVECRCHGASGACAVKSCWKRMPLINDVVKTIIQKYERAVKVYYDTTKGFTSAWDKVQNVAYGELIYGFESPTFCEMDKDFGVLGTRGRECNRTSTGMDSCQRLCCGRGFNVKTVEVDERCRCKYYWCCYVKCKQCRVKKDIATCK